MGESYENAGVEGKEEKSVTTRGQIFFQGNRINEQGTEAEVSFAVDGYEGQREVRAIVDGQALGKLVTVDVWDGDPRGVNAHLERMGHDPISVRLEADALEILSELELAARNANKAFFEAREKRAAEIRRTPSKHGNLSSTHGAALQNDWEDGDALGNVRLTGGHDD